MILALGYALDARAVHAKSQEFGVNYIAVNLPEEFKMLFDMTSDTANYGEVFNAEKTFIKNMKTYEMFVPYIAELQLCQLKMGTELNRCIYNLVKRLIENKYKFFNSALETPPKKVPVPEPSPAPKPTTPTPTTPLAKKTELTIYSSLSDYNEFLNSKHTMETFAPSWQEDIAKELKAINIGIDTGVDLKDISGKCDDKTDVKMHVRIFKELDHRPV